MNSDLQQSELWNISRQLISFDTVSTHSNVQAAEYLANLLEESGFTVRILKETIQQVEKAMVVAWGGPEEPGGLILSGHIDVVPFDGQSGWRSDPLTMQTDGQRIYGRGTSDMKIFLAQAILAARRYPVQTLKKPLVFLFTCDEELAGQGAGRLVKLIPELFANYPLPSVALIGEPTDFAIFPAHKGYAAFDIRIHGKGGHSSAPNNGLNAIEKMAEVIDVIKETNQHLLKQASSENRKLFPESPSSVFNCAVINGGLAANMIAEICQLNVSVRVTPNDLVEDLLAQLQKKLEEMARRMQVVAPETGIFVENLIVTPPLRSPSDDPFYKLLGDVMHKHTEQGAPYATDGGQFQQIGINSYICGPGQLKEAHQPNESLPVSNFLSGLTKVEQIIYEWCVKRV